VDETLQIVALVNFQKSIVIFRSAFKSRRSSEQAGNPPFVGTDNLVSKFEEKCTAISPDVGTMNKVGQTIQMPGGLPP